MFENNLAFALGKPAATGTIKTFPDDFKVNEILGFELNGEGEHLYLLIEKRGLNTEELVNVLARAIGKSPKIISYAGLKDRQAVTTQWLSIHCPGEEIDVSSVSGEGWRIIDSKRSLKKLKTGALQGNAFTLVIRNIEGKDEVEQRLHKINEIGVPNYFGLQRFGHNGQNLVKAKEVLLENKKIKNRFLKGIYYSAARSYLFNLILSARVSQGNWNKALAGDVMQLGGTHSIFNVEEPDEVINKRITTFDISPAAPLWGKGEERVTADALSSQTKAIAEYTAWMQALENHGLERAYRSMVLAVSNLKWCWEKDSLEINFDLPAGSYATSVVQELLILKD